MTRYRKIRKWGNSHVIVLLSQDVEDLQIKEGDLVDIEDAVINKSIPAELEDETKT